MVLNKKQREFMVEKGYLTPKTVDSLTHNGWERYFIEQFVWELGEYDKYGLQTLKLISNDRKWGIDYTIGLIWQNNDKAEMLGLE